MWPSIGGTPINELTTEGYFSSAFTTLFPIAWCSWNGGWQLISKMMHTHLLSSLYTQFLCDHGYYLCFCTATKKPVLGMCKFKINEGTKIPLRFTLYVRFTQTYMQFCCFYCVFQLCLAHTSNPSVHSGTWCRSAIHNNKPWVTTTSSHTTDNYNKPRSSTAGKVLPSPLHCNHHSHIYMYGAHLSSYLLSNHWGTADFIATSRSTHHMVTCTGRHWRACRLMCKASSTQCVKRHAIHFCTHSILSVIQASQHLVWCKCTELCCLKKRVYSTTSYICPSMNCVQQSI